MQGTFPVFIDNKKWHQVEGMGSIGAAVLVDHVVRVAVICGQKNSVSVFKGCRYYFFHAAVHSLNGPDAGLPDPGMANHVRVGVVQTDEICRLIFDFSKDGLSHFQGTHFWFQVIGSYFGGRDQNPFFPAKWKFPAAGEEKSDMG